MTHRRAPETVGGGVARPGGPSPTACRQPDPADCHCAAARRTAIGRATAALTGAPLARLDGSRADGRDRRRGPLDPRTSMTARPVLGTSAIIIAGHRTGRVSAPTPPVAARTAIGARMDCSRIRGPVQWPWRSARCRTSVDRMPCGPQHQGRIVCRCDARVGCATRPPSSVWPFALRALPAVISLLRGSTVRPVEAAATHCCRSTAGPSCVPWCGAVAASVCPGDRP